MKLFLGAILAIVVAGCFSSGSDDNSSTNAPPINDNGSAMLGIEINDSDAPLSPGKVFSFSVLNHSNPVPTVAIFLEGEELSVDSRGADLGRWSAVMPSVAAGNYVLEVLVDNQLVTTPVTLENNDFQGMTVPQFSNAAREESLDLLNVFLSDDLPEEFKSAGERVLGEIEAIDLSSFSDQELAEFANLYAANVKPLLLFIEELQSEQGINSKNFNAEECSRFERRFIASMLTSTAGALATGALVSSANPGAVVTLAATLIVVNVARTAAAGVLENCAAAVGDSILESIANTKHLPIDAVRGKSAGLVNLQRLTPRQFEMKRDSGLNEGVANSIAPAVNGFQSAMRIVGVRGKFHGDSTSVPAKGFDAVFAEIVGAFRSLLGLTERLSEPQRTPRKASEFQFQFAFSSTSVNVDVDRYGTTVTFTADMGDDLDTQSGTLSVIDTVAGDQTQFDVTVEQRLPVACPNLSSEFPACREANGEFSVRNGDVLSGSLNSLFGEGYRIVSNPAKGTLELMDAQAGTFEYTPPETVDNVERVQFSFVAVNPKGESDEAVIYIDIEPGDFPLACPDTDNAKPECPDARAFYLVKPGEVLAGTLEGLNNTGFRLTSEPAVGLLELTGGQSGSFSYTPPSDVEETLDVSFSFVAVREESGGSIESRPARITIRIADEVCVKRELTENYQIRCTIELAPNRTMLTRTYTYLGRSFSTLQSAYVYEQVEPVTESNLGRAMPTAYMLACTWPDDPQGCGLNSNSHIRHFQRNKNDDDSTSIESYGWNFFSQGEIHPDNDRLLNVYDSNGEFQLGLRCRRCEQAGGSSLCDEDNPRKWSVNRLSNGNSSTSESNTCPIPPSPGPAPSYIPPPPDPAELEFE